MIYIASTGSVVNIATRHWAYPDSLVDQIHKTDNVNKYGVK